MAGAPEVGTCWAISDVDVNAMSTEANEEDCDGSHTSYTFHVVHLDEVDGETPGTVARRMCRDAMPAVTEDHDLSRTVFDVVAFQPAPAQEESGAEWFRCDLVAMDGWYDVKPLPAGAPPYFVGSPIPGRYLSCFDTTTDGGMPVSCDRSHDYRWMGSFQVEEEVPNWGRIRRLGHEHCKDIAGDRYAQYVFSLPRQRDWIGGNRTVTCFGNENSLTG